MIAIRGMRLNKSCFGFLALAVLAGGCVEQENNLSGEHERFKKAVDGCRRTSCTVDFLENSDCQSAWKIQTRLPPAQNRAEELAYFQGRLLLDRSYQEALEKRLGQSHRGHYVCAQKMKPLRSISRPDINPAG